MRVTSLIAALGIGVLGAAAVAARSDDPASFNVRRAADYLDGQMDWWASWPNAQRDRGTFCVSCHTVAPYALARPALATALGERELSPAAKKLVANVGTRVSLWNEVAPFYPDQTRGIPKTTESRGSESVINALVLSTRDGQSGTLSEDTRTAFGHMWALQMKTGPLDGAWAWLNFHLEPWESDAAPYFGAAMAAAALGAAPGGYATSPDAKAGIDRLRTYVATNFDRQNLFNKLTMIAAAGRMDGFVTPEQRKAVAAAVAALQAQDGGWSLSRFADYTRVDKTAIETSSDGYATSLAVIALRHGGEAAAPDALARGVSWLRTHQDDTGRWRATSLNKQRDPASDPARFMNDAATAYAVIALSADTARASSSARR